MLKTNLKMLKMSDDANVPQDILERVKNKVVVSFIEDESETDDDSNGDYMCGYDMF